MCVQYLSLLMRFFSADSIEMTGNAQDIKKLIEEENENTIHTFHPNHLTQSKTDLERVKKKIVDLRGDFVHDISVSVHIVEDDDHPSDCGIYVFYDCTKQPPKDYEDSSVDPVGIAVQCGLAILSSLAILLTKLVRKYLKKRRRRRQEKLGVMQRGYYRDRQQRGVRKRRKLDDGGDDDRKEEEEAEFIIVEKYDDIDDGIIGKRRGEDQVLIPNRTFY